MAIPNYQYFMLPVLKAAAEKTVSLPDIIDRIADDANISEDECKITISNGSTLLYSRISWAKTYLKQAGLIENVERGLFKATNAGLDLLKTNPVEINNKTLEQYPSFNDFLKRTKNKTDDNINDNVSDNSDLDSFSPEEALHKSLNTLNSSLSSELLDRIFKSNPSFFENLIIDLFVAMGYGASGIHTGKSGDSGIDGIINQDELGVDKIYIQAKRYASDNPVGSPEIRTFIGSLNTKRAQKGVFVTTSRFTDDAKKDANTSNIVLIDGFKLTDLMIKYNVGCKIKETLYIKKIDEDFFEEI